MGTRCPRRIIITLIVAAYSLVAVLYAANVPRWNAPDEPAHFNYVRDLAERGQLPELVMGDYDAEYLERLKAARFPPTMSIDAVRYEAHQPPLYYLMAAVAYRVAAPLGMAGQVLALRLFSALLGLLLILVAYATARRIFPGNDLLALAVPAFLAFLPMHVAVAAAIGNDPLANLVFAVILWECVGLVGPAAPRSRGLLGLPFPFWRLGLWSGIALLTKTTAYPGIVVVAAAILLVSRREGGWSRGIRRLSVTGVIALGISAWWFVRNTAVYGVDDPFGLRRHALVAVDQPLTGAIDLPLLQRFGAIAFQSFWGQFGWMGVLMDERVYSALAVLSLAAALGLTLSSVAVWRGRISMTPAQRAVALLLLLTLGLVAAAMVQYSFSSFFQPQARYLFPALIPLATGFVLGIRQLTLPRHTPIVLVALLAGLFTLDLLALFRYIVPALKL